MKHEQNQKQKKTYVTLTAFVWNYIKKRISMDSKLQIDPQIDIQGVLTARILIYGQDLFVVCVYKGRFFNELLFIVYLQRIFICILYSELIFASVLKFPKELSITYIFSLLNFHSLMSLCDNTTPFRKQSDVRGHRVHGLFTFLKKRLMNIRLMCFQLLRIFIRSMFCRLFLYLYQWFYSCSKIFVQ